MWCVREGLGGPVAGYFDAIYRGGERLIVAYVCLVARKEDRGEKNYYLGPCYRKDIMIELC